MKSSAENWSGCYRLSLSLSLLLLFLLVLLVVCCWCCCSCLSCSHAWTLCTRHAICVGASASSRWSMRLCLLMARLASLWDLPQPATASVLIGQRGPKWYCVLSCCLDGQGISRTASIMHSTSRRKDVGIMPLMMRERALSSRCRSSND